MPSWLTLKLGGMIAGGLAVLAFVLLALHWKHQAADRGEKLAAICTATRSAAANPKLSCGNVVVQIGELGKSVATLKAALADQNEKVAALGAQSAQQQQQAAVASQEAAQRAKRAGKVSDSLQASSRAGERLTKPCEPSKALQEAWQ